MNSFRQNIFPSRKYPLRSPCSPLSWDFECAYFFEGRLNLCVTRRMSLYRVFSSGFFSAAFSIHSTTYLWGNEFIQMKMKSILTSDSFSTCFCIRMVFFWRENTKNGSKSDQIAQKCFIHIICFFVLPFLLGFNFFHIIYAFLQGLLARIKSKIVNFMFR